jgi:ribulose 1,5-bisphosphate synthetase/thiazole synthase
MSKLSGCLHVHLSVRPLWSLYCSVCTHIDYTATQDFAVSLQAVIGAGAAGLVAAKVLLEEGHTVLVLEQGLSMGGVWDYTDAVDADVTGEHRLVQKSTDVHIRWRADTQGEACTEID